MYKISFMYPDMIYPNKEVLFEEIEYSFPEATEINIENGTQNNI